MRRKINAYTNFVKLFKSSLWIMVALLLLVVVALPIIKEDRAGVRIAFSSDDSLKDEKQIMKKPRFQGMSNDNKPYFVTADYAVQKNDNEIVLHKVKADMVMEDSSWMMITANEGLLDSLGKMLFFSGKVHIFHDSGYEFATEKVKIDTAEENIYSESAVKGHGMAGSISAERFTAYDRGERMLFDGNVKLVILPQQLK